MKRVTLVVMALGASSVFTQVHIRENATITPRPVNTVQSVVTPVITVIPSMIAPGDTANIDVKWQNPDEPMLVDIVEGGIVSGEDYGELLDYAGNMAAYLWSVATPLSSSSYTETEFWFIASDGIDVDSARVAIRWG